MSASALSSRAIIGSFYRRLKQNSGLKWVEAISNYFQSDQDSETYNWLGRERVCQDDFCKFSKFKYLSAEKSPNISCLHIS